MHSPCLNFVRDTAKTLGLKTIITDRADVFKYLSKSNLPFDLIFADPPYELAKINQISDLVLQKQITKPIRLVN